MENITKVAKMSDKITKKCNLGALRTLIGVVRLEEQRLKPDFRNPRKSWM